MGKGGKVDRYEQEGEPCDNLYICGLPEAFDSDSVQQFFGAVGNVMQCRSFGNGFALVRFATMQEAVMVKTSLNGQKPIGCTEPLKISFAIAEKKNDWHCPRCGDLQFQKNKQCRMCGCPRPQGGEDAVSPVDPSTGLPAFAEGGDWSCPQCGDLQFKRNLTCRLCGTPSPAAGGALPEGGTILPVFGKATGKAKGGPSPYGAPGGKGGKDGKIKGGPMCSLDELINELITGGLPGGDHLPNVNCVYVGGLPGDTTEENLYQIFATFGPIPPKGTRIDANEAGECSGSGVVHFMESASADMAVMALNGIQMAGFTLEVRKIG